MKLSPIAVATSLALGLSVSVMASAEDQRYIITYKNNLSSQGHAAVQAAGGRSALKLKKGKVEAAYLDDASLARLKTDKNIASIEDDHKRYPNAIWNDDAGDPTAQQITPYGVYQAQANLLTLNMANAKTVCVIDAGIAGGQGEVGGLNNDFVWSNITGTSDVGTGDWFTDGGAHGTHVAGTVAAADNGFGVVGMAPGNPLHIIKVFNDAGWGYSSDLAFATDRCTDAGADIITMSLGGGGANATEENAFINFTANGGLVVAAAGNDGNNVTSFPAGYQSVMMVGAVDANDTIASFSQFPPESETVRSGPFQVTTAGVEISAGGVDTFSTFPAGAATISAMTADGASFASQAMENSGSSSGATFNMGTAEATDPGANGKICIIQRGVISFHDKTLNCENSGGIGAIIYNNEPGMLFGTLGDPNNTTIPVVGATMEDGPALEAASNATINIGTGDYGSMSGTSMATPTVSGVAALVWSQHPNCTGTEVRDALKATAQDQGAAGRDDFYGHGIVKALDASNYLAGQACGGTPPPPGNSPPFAAFSANCTLLDCNFDASASSDSDGTIASYSWTLGDSSTASGVTAAHSYAANGSYTVTLTVTDNEGASSNASQTVNVDDGTAPPPADIQVSGFRAGNGRSITLNWTGATTANVDIFVNGNFNNTTANDGEIVFTINKNSGLFSFVVCEEGSTVACSDPISL